MHKCLIWLLLITGCANTQELDPKWTPLTHIVERPHLKGYESITTTITPNIYVADLDTFLEQAETDPVYHHALMLHEQVHAVRQKELGLTSWLYKYTFSPSFRLAEEKAGYEVMIRHLVKSNYFINREDLASGLSNYYNGMITYDDALAWINDVIKQTR